MFDLISIVMDTNRDVTGDVITKYPLTFQFGSLQSQTEEACLFQKRQSERNSLTYCWHLT